MSKNIYILGAGSHARSLATLLEHCGYDINGVFDNTYHPNEKEFIGTYPLIGTEKDIRQNLKLALAYGDCLIREKNYLKYKDQIIIENFKHPTSFIEKHVQLGYANQILANVYINSFAIIGSNNLINSGCIIEHEAIIGNHNHLSVNSIICGRVVIGNRCFIGAGAVVIDKVKICDDVTIGANSTVISDINEKGIYVGSPVRKLI